MPFFSPSRSKDRGVGRRINSTGQVLSGGTFTRRERPTGAVVLELPPQPVRKLSTPIVRPPRHRAMDTGTYSTKTGDEAVDARSDPKYCSDCRTMYATEHQANHHICRR